MGIEKQEPSAAHVKWPSLTKHSHQTPSRRQSWTHMAGTATEKETIDTRVASMAVEPETTQRGGRLTGGGRSRGASLGLGL